jgi:hypothetical protein
MRENREFFRGVTATDIRRAIRLRVSAIDGLRQRTLERSAALERARKEVRRAIQDSCDAQRSAHERPARPGADERNSGEYRCFVREGHARAPRERAQLLALLGHQRLVRGHNGNAGLERLSHVLVCRMNAAHRFDDHIEVASEKCRRSGCELNGSSEPRLGDIANERRG